MAQSNLRPPFGDKKGGWFAAPAQTEGASSKLGYSNNAEGKIDKLAKNEPPQHCRTCVERCRSTLGSAFLES
jgi:hypothetical protein